MLIQRIITALIIGPLAIAAIFYLPLDYFAVLMLVVISIGAWEWGPLMNCAMATKRTFYTLSHIALIAILWNMLPLTSIWIDSNTLQQSAVYVLWLSVAWWALSAFLIVTYPKFTLVWAKHRIIRGSFGWLTLVPTWLAFMVLRSSHYSLDPYHGAEVIMFLFLMVWSADIGAYFSGKMLGKHKLMPNVSPGKTIEGFLGGMILACVLMIAAGNYLQWSQEQLFHAILVTILITIISVIGDLSESMLKRQAGVKDSGCILPGHGGILDRIDSLTATTPIFALCYLYLGW